MIVFFVISLLVTDVSIHRIFAFLKWMISRMSGQSITARKIIWLEGWCGRFRNPGFNGLWCGVEMALWLQALVVLPCIQVFVNESEQHALVLEQDHPLRRRAPRERAMRGPVDDRKRDLVNGTEAGTWGTHCQAPPTTAACSSSPRAASCAAAGPRPTRAAHLRLGSASSGRAGAAPSDAAAL